MKPKISLITLGVTDLERATRFYRDGLGLPQHEVAAESIAFFELTGTWLALYERAALAGDIGVEPGPPAAFPGFALAHNVPDREQVDAVLRQAVAAGAALVKPAEEVFWGGYSGYFRDPEGYYWEVAHNPFMDLT